MNLVSPTALMGSENGPEVRHSGDQSSRPKKHNSGQTDGETCESIKLFQWTVIWTLKKYLCCGFFWFPASGFFFSGFLGVAMAVPELRDLPAFWELGLKACHHHLALPQTFKARNFCLHFSFIFLSRHQTRTSFTTYTWVLYKETTNTLWGLLDRLIGGVFFCLLCPMTPSSWKKKHRPDSIMTVKVTSSKVGGGWLKIV